MTLMIHTTYAYEDSRKEWIGMVLEIDPAETSVLVLSVGAESTEGEIKQWLELSVEAEGWVPGNEDPPDMYTRGMYGLHGVH